MNQNNGNSSHLLDKDLPIIPLFNILRIIEITEKYLRLEKYIDEAEIGVEDRRSQLISFIRQAIDREVNRLRTTWHGTVQLNNYFILLLSGEQEIVRQDNEPATYSKSEILSHRLVNQSTDILAAINKSLTELKKLHDCLCWFYTPWAEAETDIFLKDIFEHHGNVKLFTERNFSVGFTDRYEFWYPYPPQHFGEFSSAPRVITLPRIEKNNALIWPFLVHEVMHGIILANKFNKEIKESLEKSLSNPSESKINLLLRWGGELSADLAALFLLGPSYYLTCINYYTFTFCDEKMPLTIFQRDSSNYPSIFKRLTFIKKQLELMDHRFSREYNIPLYWKLFNIRLMLEKETMRGQDKEREEIPTMNLTDGNSYEILERICSDWVMVLFSKLGLSTFSLAKYEGSLDDLITRFLNSELISSKRIHPRMEENECDTFMKNVSDRLMACELVKEKACSAVEIINSGWLAELKDYEKKYYNRAIDSEPLATIVEEKEYLSRLLQKSLETASIQRFFEDNNKSS